MATLAIPVSLTQPDPRSNLEIEVTSVKDAGCSGHLSNSKMYKGPPHTHTVNQHVLRSI